MPEPSIFTAQQADASPAVHSWVTGDSSRAAAVGRALQRHYRADWGVASYEDARDADINVSVRWDVESAYDLGVDEQGRLLLLMVTTTRHGRAWNRRRLTTVRFPAEIEHEARSGLGSGGR